MVFVLCKCRHLPVRKHPPLPWWVSRVFKRYVVVGVGGFFGGGVSRGHVTLSSARGCTDQWKEGGGECDLRINGGAIKLRVIVVSRFLAPIRCPTGVSHLSGHIKKEMHKSASHLRHKMSKMFQTCVWAVPSEKMEKGGCYMSPFWNHILANTAPFSHMFLIFLTFAGTIFNVFLRTWAQEGNLFSPQNSQVLN